MSPSQLVSPSWRTPSSFSLHALFLTSGTLLLCRLTCRSFRPLAAGMERGQDGPTAVLTPSEPLPPLRPRPHLCLWRLTTRPQLSPVSFLPFGRCLREMTQGRGGGTGTRVEAWARMPTPPPAGCVTRRGIQLLQAKEDLCPSASARAGSEEDPGRQAAVL